VNFNINKEDGDKLLEDFLIEITRENGSKRCAEESCEILESNLDCQLVIETILKNSFKINGMIPNHIKVFEASLLAALITVFSCCEIKDIPKPLHVFFEDTKNENDIFERVKNSKKLRYAISHFVDAYFHYDYFENKYPEISKKL
jgi:hypothetical protein